MSKGNGRKSPEPTPRELAFASAIGKAVRDHLNPELSGIKSELVKINGSLEEHGKKLDQHTTKLDQLIAGGIGIGRMTKLEDRVAELERRQPK